MMQRCGLTSWTGCYRGFMSESRCHIWTGPHLWDSPEGMDTCFGIGLIQGLTISFCVFLLLYKVQTPFRMHQGSPELPGLCDSFSCSVKAYGAKRGFPPESPSQGPDGRAGGTNHPEDKAMRCARSVENLITIINSIQSSPASYYHLAQA